MNNDMVVINNENLSVKELNGQRVITFKDIDRLHKRADGTAKRNFNSNKKHFIEKVDYFFVKPKDVEKYEIRTSEINNAGTYLITESGYLMIVKSLTDDLAWQVQRELVNTYFRYKGIVPNNEFDIMRMYIDKLEYMKYGIKRIENNQKEQDQKIKEIEDKMDITISDDDSIASDIAHQLKLYSESGLPHNNLIGAIARHLKFKVGYKKWYKDEYIKIIGSKNGDLEHWQVYYTPKGANAIIEWFEKNKSDIYYEVLYKRGAKKGTVKERGYNISGVNFKVK